MSALCLLSCRPPDIRLGMGDGNGVGLAYRMVGKGKPLVVINDGPGYEKTLMYRGFDNLRSDMRIIYYDQRGCGRSEPLTPSQPSAIRDNVLDLESLRRYFHLSKISIVAHGWGAVIGLEYARNFPDNVESIVLITPISPFSPEPQMDSILDKLPAKARDAVTTALNSPGTSMLEQREAIMRAIVPALFYRQEASKNLDFADMRFAADVNIRLGEELKSLDLFPVLPEVKQPTLVIVGMHDISTPVRDQMAYADGIRNASAVVFNDSGHFPFLEEPAFFSNLIKEFLFKRRVPTLVYADRES